MASRLYNYFLTGWVNGTVSEEQVNNAVTKGYITEEEARIILDTPRIQGV